MTRIKMSLFSDLLDEHVNEHLDYRSWDYIRRELVEKIQETTYWFLENFGVYPDLKVTNNLIFRLTFDSSYPIGENKENVIFDFCELIQEYDNQKLFLLKNILTNCLIMIDQNIKENEKEST